MWFKTTTILLFLTSLWFGWRCCWTGLVWLELDGQGWPHPGLASVGMAGTAGPASTSSLKRPMHMAAVFQERGSRSCKAYWDLGSELGVTSHHSSDQKKSQGQPRLNGWGNRFCLLMGGAAENVWPFAIEHMASPLCFQLWSQSMFKSWFYQALAVMPSES